jgi:hypothetical protein
MGIPVEPPRVTFDIDEVIRDASTSEKMSLLSGTAPNYAMTDRLTSADNG